MNFETFTPLAIRTESVVAPIAVAPQLLDALLTTAIAIGTLLDYVKKNVAYNKPIDMTLWKHNVDTITDNLNSIADASTEDFVSEKDTPLAMDTRMFHGIVGSFTESTELLEAAKRAMITGEWDFVNIKEEIADGQWYNAIMLDAMGANMGDLLTTVINKLKLRYPNKYSDEAAINRDVIAERVVLEAGSK